MGAESVAVVTAEMWQGAAATGEGVGTAGVAMANWVGCAERASGSVTVVVAGGGP